MNTVFKERGGEQNHFPPLTKKIETEVAIIGGGITGLVTALLLHKANVPSVVIEALSVGDGTTGSSTSHLTTDIDKNYQYLYRDFDEEITKIVAESRVKGIDLIENIINEIDILCDFKRVSGYYYAATKEKIKIIEKEYHFAKNAGLDVSMTAYAPLPFKSFSAVKFRNQAQFNSQKFLNGIAKYLFENNYNIYENSRVTNITEKEDHVVIDTVKGKVIAKKVVVATHIPLLINVLQSMVAPYMSYIITAKLKPMEEYPEGLFWDSNDPYNYLRTYSDGFDNFLVAGGFDNKSGSIEDTEKKLTQLENFVRQNFEVERVIHKWAAEYFESVDGLPYIGKSPFSQNIYVATGFSGDGLVYGPIAAKIITDIIQDKENNWLKAYDATRFAPIPSIEKFIKENLDNASHFIKDRMQLDDSSLDDLKPGDGKIMKINGKKMAVARDTNNEIHALSPICTHLKCVVNWNNFEKIWDCPCHGSRFSIDGEVIYGPATTSLKKMDIKQSIDSEKKSN